MLEQRSSLSTPTFIIEPFLLDIFRCLPLSKKYFSQKTGKLVAGTTTVFRHMKCE
jgi:hypothetical protein